LCPKNKEFILVDHAMQSRGSGGYETKGVQPPADVLSRLAGVFDVSIDYLGKVDKYFHFGYWKVRTG